MAEKSLIQVDNKYYSYADNMSKYGVAQFKFNEVSGNVLDNKSSAVGTITGGVTRVDGFDGQGKALSFNGSNGYVSFNQSVLPSTGSFSIRLKLYPHEFKTTQFIISNQQSTDLAHRGMRLVLANNKVIFVISNGTSNVVVFTSSNEVIQNSWNDVVVMFDRSSTKATTIINNQKEEISFANFTGDFTGTANLHIGQDMLKEAGRYFNGQIDNLEIYNDVIDPDKIEITILDQENFNVNKENNFINYGMSKGLEVDLLSDVNKITLPTLTSIIIDTGKVFRQKIDTSKHSIKNVSIT